jgi:hypothetical protein
MEFYSPSWPTLFPLFQVYKKDYPTPHGLADTMMDKGNRIDYHENVPFGVKANEMFYKYFSYIK